jgi:hypothetical protein
MRRMYLLAAAVAMLLFALAPAAQAEVVMNEDVPLDQVVSFSCPDPDPDVGYVPSEDIRVTGTVHILVTSTVDQAGNTHDVGDINHKNVTGVGLTSGDSYVWRTEGSSAVNVRPSDPEGTANDGGYTLIYRGRMIHLGEGGSELGDDQMFRQTVRLTLDENGEYTTQFERQVEYCN